MRETETLMTMIVREVGMKIQETGTGIDAGIGTGTGILIMTDTVTEIQEAGIEVVKETEIIIIDDKFLIVILMIFLHSLLLKTLLTKFHN